MKPPVAERIPHTTVIHGETLHDDYFWLRDKDNPAVRAYLEAENKYCNEAMADTAAFQDALYREMLGRIKETDSSAPYAKSGFEYYSRTEEGKQYPILCRRASTAGAPEQITLDLNALAGDRPYLGLGVYSVSNDTHILAHSLDFTGFRQYSLQFKDLRSGELFPDKIEKTGSVAWDGDAHAVLYTVEDDAKRQYRVYRHVLGTPVAADVLLFEEPDALYRVYVSRSLDGGFLFITSASNTTSDVRFIRCGQAQLEPRLMRQRQEGIEYYATHANGRFFIRTNDLGPNFRIATAPVAAPDAWAEWLSHDDAVMLEDFQVFSSHMVVSERQDGLPHLRVMELATRESHRISTPDPVYSLDEGNNAEFETTRLQFRYQSFITPLSTFEYDMVTRERTLLKQTEVLGGFDRERYVCERVFARAADGTAIPITIARRRDLQLNGRNPLQLQAYGSYGISIPIVFSSSRLSLLDRGVIAALAHVRGGGDLGKRWHEAGRLMSKKNTFTDFIAAAEHLIATGYTSSSRLAIVGGSAGGLLIAAALNMRPELFRVAIAHVPFVDVINTMLDASLPLTIGEYLEWGNPNVKADYDYMKSCCPYTNLKADTFPALLVKTSFNDSQVMYWEPAKYVAKMRTLTTGKHLLLLKTNLDAGHSGPSGRYDALRELAFDYAFLLKELGLLSA